MSKLGDFAEKKWAAFAVLWLSVAIIAVLYCQWPSGICYDMNYSVRVAQNALAGNGFVCMDPNVASQPEDPAEMQPQWMTTWPPGVSMLYFLFMSCGLSAGGAAWVLGIITAGLGCMGWLALLRQAGCGKRLQLFLGGLLPWLSVPALIWTNLFNDHIIWAITPWFFFMLLRMVNLSQNNESTHPYRFALTGILGGFLLIFKFSALPLLPGGWIFLLTVDRFRMWRSRRKEFILFSGGLALPPVTLFLLNKFMTGEVSTVVKAGAKYCMPEMRQLANLFLVPLLHTSGMARMAGRAYDNSTLMTALTCASVILGLVMVYGLYRVGRKGINSHLLWLLIVMTVATQLFLISFTATFGYYCDWTSVDRYYLPATFGWLLVGGMLVTSRGWNKLGRMALAVLLLIPCVYSVAATVAKPILRDSPPIMPVSRLAWFSSFDQPHAEFASKMVQSSGGPPDFAIVADPYQIPEVFCPQIVLDRRVKMPTQFKPTRALRVWALVKEKQVQETRELLGAASRVETVQVPTGYPYVVLIAEYTMESRQ